MLIEDSFKVSVKKKKNQSVTSTQIENDVTDKIEMKAQERIKQNLIVIEEEDEGEEEGWTENKLAS